MDEDKWEKGPMPQACQQSQDNGYSLCYMNSVCGVVKTNDGMSPVKIQSQHDKCSRFFDQI